MLLRHMLQLHQRFTLLCLQTAVARNATAMEIHLNNSFCYANVHFFANQIVWNGIFVPAVTHEIVVRHLSSRPYSGFKRCGGQRQHIRLFFLKISAAARASVLLEFPVVQFFELFSNRLVEFAQREKLHITQCRNNPGLHQTNRRFRSTFVLRFADTGRYDCGTVILGKFLITAVQHGFITGVRYSCGLAVVRDEQPCHAAEIIESVNMAVQPVLGFHVVAGFCIDITAAREHRYKQISRTLCSSN